MFFVPLYFIDRQNRDMKYKLHLNKRGANIFENVFFFEQGYSEVLENK